MKREHDDHTCCCCQQQLAQADVCGWIGSIELVPLCLHCFRLYHSMRTVYPDHGQEDVLNMTRMLHAYEQLPRHLQPKLRRLIILLENDSKRARRLVAMANDTGMPLAQLLSIL